MTFLAARSASFLEDICCHPEDDTVRLIYADFLEDIGEDARAEFIRVQIELARTPEYLDLGEGKFGAGPIKGYGIIRAGNPCYGELNRREQELLSSAPRWLGWWRFLENADSARPTLLRPSHWVVWRRGFVAEITIPVKEFMANAAQLFRSQPLEVVHLSDVVPAESTDYPDDVYIWREGYLSTGWRELCWLPVPLWDLMAALSLGEVRTKGGWCRYFPSVEIAQKAISQVCVHFGRKEAFGC